MVCADVLCHRNRAFVAFSRLSSIRSIPSRGRIWGRGTMRLSCNGCRVLRKGCSDSCVLRPCLQWIETAESQANATVFLAKFYGRAGLMNLIADGPEHLRPAIFRSLLYEACGRMVNPIHGSVGLLMSGNWQSCEAGVESILQGHPICHPHSNLGNDNVSEPDPGQYVQSSGNSLLMKSIAKELHKVKSRGRFRCNGSRNARGKKRLRELAGSDEDKIACASSERRSIIMADKAQSSRYCNDSSSESDRNEDDDRYNSCESNIQILSMICKSPKVEDEYHDCADDCSDVVGLELTLGSPRIPNDGKSYSGNTSQSCAEGRSLVMCSTLSLT